MLLKSRGWIPFFKSQAFRKLAGGQWVFVKKNNHSFWIQNSHPIEYPTHIQDLKDRFNLDNVHKTEFYGSVFLHVGFVGKCGGVVDFVFKTLQGEK